MTDLKCPYKNLLLIFNGKVPYQHRSKELPLYHHLKITYTVKKNSDGLT